MENTDLYPGQAEERGEPARAALEYLRRFQWLERFTDDELRRISYCTEGTPLSVGGVYFDISHPELGPLTAQEAQSVPQGSCYVAREDVDEKTWINLIRPFT